MVLGLILQICQTAAMADNGASYNSTMKWGSYRPNLYFGTRTRDAATLLTGLAWFGATNMEDKPWDSIQNFH